jgi:hypothetical protein
VTNHDRIEVANSLLQVIPVTIAAEWATGHYTGKKEGTQTLHE